jgi:hypothetical protein
MRTNESHRLPTAGNTILIGLLAGVAALPTAIASAQQVGVSAAVRGDVQLVAAATPSPRAVRSGEAIFLRDSVTTGESSGMQVMLLDESTFTIGDNAQVVIDEFVYDPSIERGKVAVSILGNGFFRFVTGKIARSEATDMRVRVPTGTIGIRGTIVSGYTEGTRTVVGLIGPGPSAPATTQRGGIDIETGGTTFSIRRPGWGLAMEQGQAPRLIELSQVDVQRMQGRSPQTGPRGAAPARHDGLRNPATGDSAGPAGALAAMSPNGSAAFGQPVDKKVHGPINFDAAQQTQSNAMVANATGATTWQVMQGIRGGGVGTYQQNGVPIFESGVQRGTVDMNLTVNFGTRRIGSSINVPADINPGFGGTLAQGTVNFAEFNYATASPGPAVVIREQAGCGASVNCSLRVEFRTRDSKPAKLADTTFQVKQAGGPGVASGTATLVARSR